MSYRNLKKNFNISDADYYRLPERRKKFYVHNAPILLETAKVYPVAPPAAVRRADSVITPTDEQIVSARRREPDFVDNIVTGLAIGAGMAIAENVVDSLFNDDETSPMDSSIFSDNSTPDIEFGGGDFGGAG